VSIHRFNAKVDSTSADLVKALKELRVQVWVIRQPVDLLLRFWCNRHQAFCWLPLEVKTPYGVRDPKPRVRKNQQAQTDFLELTDTPVACDLRQAIQGINRYHQLAVNL
jgi:hypothetical protein